MIPHRLTDSCWVSTRSTKQLTCTTQRHQPQRDSWNTLTFLQLLFHQYLTLSFLVCTSRRRGAPCSHRAAQTAARSSGQQKPTFSSAPWSLWVFKGFSLKLSRKELSSIISNDTQSFIHKWHDIQLTCSLASWVILATILLYGSTIFVLILEGHQC